MMWNLKVLLAILLSIYFQNCNAIDTKAIQYLRKFGYINTTLVDYDLRDSDNEFLKAVKTFQNFAGLKVTGLLDDDTLQKMSQPRCGVKDSFASLRTSNFVAEGGVWEKTNLTYKVTKYSRNMSRAQFNRDLKTAFKFWSDVTSLQFFKKEAGDVDIEIAFYTGSHGDRDPFDGPGGVLAHARFPDNGGDLHMDDSENWTRNSEEGKNILHTLTHEIGHSLGLDHLRNQSAVMAAIYRGYNPDFKLHEDDIQAIQALYGKKTDKKKQGGFIFPTTSQPRKISGKPTGQALRICQHFGLQCVNK